MPLFVATPLKNLFSGAKATTVHDPESIQQRSSLSELLQPLNRDQLQALLESLSEEQPDIMEQIEWQLQQDNIAAQLSASQANASQPKVRHTRIDPKPFRRQVENILRYSPDNWDDSPALYEIRSLISKADEFIANACDRAEAIMDEGQAKHYHHAVNWLQFAQRAYQQTERPHEWQQCYAELRQKHARKRKLIDLMNSLDKRHPLQG